CRAGHPLLGKRSLQPADVRRYPLVYSNVSPEHADYVQDIDPGFAIDQVTGNVLPSIAVASCRLMYDMVEASDAISIAHRSQVDDGVAQGRMVVLALPWQRKPPSAEFGVAYKRERTLPPSARTLIGLIRKRMRTVKE